MFFATCRFLLIRDSCNEIVAALHSGRRAINGRVSFGLFLSLAFFSFLPSINVLAETIKETPAVAGGVAKSVQETDQPKPANRDKVEAIDADKNVALPLVNDCKVEATVEEELKGLQRDLQKLAERANACEQNPVHAAVVTEGVKNRRKKIISAEKKLDEALNGLEVLLPEGD